jgi:putative oxidoreductase
MTLGMHLLRITVGSLFAGHGAQKLFGWFGGHGPDGTGQFFEMLGLRPGRHHALAAGSAELAGGALFAAGGTKVPAGEAALSGVLITAIRHAHSGKGPWVTDGGYEYPLVLLAAIFAASEQRHGTGWALGQLAAGAVGSIAVAEYSRRQPATAEPAPGAQAADGGGGENGDRAANAAMAATAPAGAAPSQADR